MDRTELWQPSPQRIEGSQLRAFMARLADTHGVQTRDYADLHAWSVSHLDEFWEAIWSHFDVIGERGTGPVREGDSISATRWFPGAALNYAENLLRQAEATPDAEAVVGLHETGARETLTWAQLRAQVASLAAHLRRLGVGPGDTVCAVLPAIVQTPVALLATASLGAIWSVVNTDFGVDGIADRFAQIEPRVLFTVDSHEFGGTHRDQLAQLPAVLEALPTVRHHILVDTLTQQAAGDHEASGVTGSDADAASLTVPSARWSEIIAEEAQPQYERKQPRKTYKRGSNPQG